MTKKLTEYDLEKVRTPPIYCPRWKIEIVKRKARNQGRSWNNYMLWLIERIVNGEIE